MKKQEFNTKVSEMCKFINEAQVDNISQQLRPFAEKYKTQGVFAYARWCEMNFEANLREDYERKTTYTNDFSIAEWCVPIEGMRAIASTFRNALTNWRDSLEFFAEIIIVLNLKSWEHHARGNANYSRLYSELYYAAKDLYFDWFDKEHKDHDKAMQYYFDYID